MTRRNRQPAQTGFGCWIRRRRVGGLAAGATLLLGIAVVTPSAMLGLVLAGLAAAGFGTVLFLVYVTIQLSERGLGLQRAAWAQVLDLLPWDGAGSALDVGTGNGALAILLAERFPHARVSGIDPWGASWSYSRATCLRNAEERGVGQRIAFIPGSAARLPFEAESFDAVVSNLAFHEVSDVADKRRLLHESLRVLRKGGAFSLQDLFFDPRLYGPVDALLASLRASGARDVHIIALHQRIQLPPLLSGRRVLGAAGILFGTK